MWDHCLNSSLAKISLTDLLCNILLITVVYHCVGDFAHAIDEQQLDESKMLETYVCETWKV
jgi:hypothetical protein